MTCEVMRYLMKNLYLHNVSIHRILPQNLFIHECARNNLFKISESLIFFGRCRKTYILKKSGLLYAWVSIELLKIPKIFDLSC